MFGKKKKRLEISAPSNFEHRVHTGFDPREQKFTGLPQQWQSLLADTANRPKPMVDPSYITPIQLAPMKVRLRRSSPPRYRSCITVQQDVCFDTDCIEITAEGGVEVVSNSSPLELELFK
ncbi:hypothetical protein Z043_105234 [Scleropages formosus]|uniref:non-specific serine/threonine protein kinase n=1 Tax=Scleropages formosus TaxID=113540 RepID=A0A0P7XGZ6_SCLFO|nr:hypothetical protein Z043_105234 [Scleropages formosus]